VNAAIQHDADPGQRSRTKPGGSLQAMMHVQSKQEVQPPPRYAHLAKRDVVSVASQVELPEAVGSCAEGARNIQSFR